MNYVAGGAADVAAAVAGAGAAAAVAGGWFGLLFTSSETTS